MAVVSSYCEASCLVRQRARPTPTVASLAFGLMGTLLGPPLLKGRKDWATVGQHAPNIRATRGLQWLGQWVPTPKGEGNLLNPSEVRIAGCNSPA